LKISVLGCGRWGSFIAWYQATQLKNQVISWGPQGDYSYEILKMILFEVYSGVN